MFVYQMIVGAAGTAFPGSENVAAQKALIAFVCIYIFFFASTWGPCKKHLYTQIQHSPLTYKTKLLGSLLVKFSG
jgi:hypothetical protein